LAVDLGNVFDNTESGFFTGLVDGEDVHPEICAVDKPWKLLCQKAMFLRRKRHFRWDAFHIAPGDFGRFPPDMRDGDERSLVDILGTQVKLAIVTKTAKL
jgi:hypothetical protein